VSTPVAAFRIANKIHAPVAAARKHPSVSVRIKIFLIRAALAADFDAE
jgi:hypothetical protein